MAMSTGWSYRRRVAPEPTAVARAICFELVPAQKLPVITNTQTIGSLVLGKRRWAATISAIARNATACKIAYFAGMFYRIYGVMVSVRYSGGWWLVLSPILLFPLVLSMTFSMRYGFVLTLMQSFDFWFFFAANVVCVVSAFVAFQDARMALWAMAFIELESSKMIDANAQRLPILSLTLLIDSISLFVCTVGIAVGVIHIHDVVVWRTPTGCELRLEDIVLNAMATVTVLLMRIAYNRRDAWRNMGDCYVRCVTCRCRLAFSGCTGSNSIRSAASQLELRDPAPVECKPPMKLSMIQLECVMINETFPVDRVLGGNTLSTSTSAPWLLRFWLLVSASSLGGIAALDDPRKRAWLAPVTLFVTAVAVSPFIALHQTQLLRRLFRSFDFLFLLLQVVSAGICMCHLLDWEILRCAVVLCVALWSYVTITYDALTPAAKQTLQWSPRRAAALALFLLGLHLALAIQILFGVSWDVRDRVLMEVVVFGYQLRVFVIPLLLSRLLILVIWKGRLVWRLLRCSRRPGGEMELITLQGVVQYKRQQSMRQRMIAQRTP